MTFRPSETVPMELRPVTSAELPFVAALARTTWRVHYPGIITVPQIEYMLDRMYGLDVLQAELLNGVDYDGLWSNGNLVAFASSGPVAPDALKLHKLYVHPQWQRRGCGSRLLAAVETKATVRGFFSVILSVNKANAQAINAYRKNGYSIREHVAVDIGGGFVMDDYIMEKRL